MLKQKDAAGVNCGISTNKLKTQEARIAYSSYIENDTKALRHHKGTIVNNPLINHLNYEV